MKRRNDETMKTNHGAIRAVRRWHRSPKKEFWRRWSTRLAVTAAVIAWVDAVAVLGDPGAESWPTKLAECVQKLVTAVP
jgi:hypothetical protein